MYFIKKGKFSVHVKTDYIKVEDMDEKENNPVSILIDNDHFGEIGLLYDCRRTATVKSENYGNLAMLKKSAFNELSKTFEMFQGLFK